jgi:thiamine biosynthesis lipoprotein
METTSLRGLERRVGDELERIEQIFSLFRPSSELSRLNAAPSGKWIDVSPDLLAVAKRALDLAHETGGAFDPTIAPLVRLWRMQQPTSDWLPPKAAAIAEAMQRVGFQHVETREDSPAIRKLVVDIEMDLNALVEGWAIDRVMDLLQQSGIANALFELGGEFRAIGQKRDSQPWKVGIENPLEPSFLYATTTLANAALATSGNYRQTIEYHGRHYGHILDARSGEPVQHDLLAISVIASDAVTADGFATALMALGPSEGFALAEKKGLAASFGIRGSARLHVKLTKAALGKINLVNK